MKPIIGCFCSEWFRRLPHLNTAVGTPSSRVEDRDLASTDTSSIGIGVKNIKIISADISANPMFASIRKVSLTDFDKRGQIKLNLKISSISIEYNYCFEACAII